MTGLILFDDFMLYFIFVEVSAFIILFLRISDFLVKLNFGQSECGLNAFIRGDAKSLNDRTATNELIKFIGEDL